MMNGKSILALIPARGGSRRVPGKNIRPLGGKPLIAWTIETARAVSCIDEVLVSTDDSQIAQVAHDCGASVPWLRPADLATDTASSIDVIEHALAQRKRDGWTFDVLLLLQPTSPFRSTHHVEQVLHMCIDAAGAPVVAFAPARTHPAWCFTIDEGGLARPIIAGDGTSRRSQDLPPAFEISGSLYAIGTQEFEASRGFFTPKTRALVIQERHLAIDIDDEFDWMVAEAVAMREFTSP
jgi:CMP-N,N'-diacetyllegionaminic acid synthase